MQARVSPSGKYTDRQTVRIQGMRRMLVQPAQTLTLAAGNAIAEAVAVPQASKCKFVEKAGRIPPKANTGKNCIAQARGTLGKRHN